MLSRWQACCWGSQPGPSSQMGTEGAAHDHESMAARTCARTKALMPVPRDCQGTAPGRHLARRARSLGLCLEGCVSSADAFCRNEHDARCGPCDQPTIGVPQTALDEAHRLAESEHLALAHQWSRLRSGEKADIHVDG